MDEGRKVTNTCIKCKKIFKTSKSKADRKHCSVICNGSEFKRIKKACFFCSNIYFAKSTKVDSKYCSKECKNKGLIQPPLTYYEILTRLKRSYEKMVINNSEGCLGWKGYKNKNGYGSL
jgi:hypothetical protein